MKRLIALSGTLLLFGGCFELNDDTISDAKTEFFQSHFLRLVKERFDEADEALKVCPPSPPSQPAGTPLKPGAPCPPQQNLPTPPQLPQTVKAINCTCEVWKPASEQKDKTCTCKQICPMDARIFRKSPPALDSKLPFTNLAGVFSGPKFNNQWDKFNGYCTGFATVSQKFSRLATFSPSVKPPVDPTEGTGEKKGAEWFKFYKRKIDSLLDENTPVDFPGFKSLNDLASHPALGDYFKEKVRDFWKERSEHSAAITSISYKKKLNSEEIKSLVTQLRRRLKYGIFTGLDFGSSNGSAHSVLVTGISDKADGTIELEIDDPNYDGTLSSITISPDGTISHSDTGDWPLELTDLKINLFDDADLVQQGMQLHSKCRLDTLCKADKADTL